MLDLGKYSEPWKSRKTADIRNEIRRDYDVPLPIDSFLFGPVCKDLRHEYGKEAYESVGLEECIAIGEGKETSIHDHKLGRSVILLS
jgi:hypothetical protein